MNHFVLWKKPADANPMDWREMGKRDVREQAIDDCKAFIAAAKDKGLGEFVCMVRHTSGEKGQWTRTVWQSHAKEEIHQ